MHPGLGKDEVTGSASATGRLSVGGRTRESARQQMGLDQADGGVAGGSCLWYPWIELAL